MRYATNSVSLRWALETLKTLKPLSLWQLWCRQCGKSSGGCRRNMTSRLMKKFANSCEKLNRSRRRRQIFASFTILAIPSRSSGKSTRTLWSEARNCIDSYRLQILRQQYFSIIRYTHILGKKTSFSQAVVSITHPRGTREPVYRFLQAARFLQPARFRVRSVQYFGSNYSFRGRRHIRRCLALLVL